MNVVSAVTIWACGLTFSARDTAVMLMAKNTTTRAAPSTLPRSPLEPPTAALSAIMIAAAPAATTAERRAIGP